MEDKIDLSRVRQTYYDNEKQRYILTIEDDDEHTIYIKSLTRDEYFKLISNSMVKNNNGEPSN